MLFPFMTRLRRRSTSSSSHDQDNPTSGAIQATSGAIPNTSGPQPEVRRSTRRLFEDTQDSEISLKSPFKILKSPFKTPTKKAVAQSLFSPIKNSDIDTKTPKKRKCPAHSPPLFKDDKPKTTDVRFDELLAQPNSKGDADLEPVENLLMTPTTKTYTKVDSKSRSSPSPSRPHRTKKFVERMGIDDIKLLEVGLSSSPRLCKTPQPNLLDHEDLETNENKGEKNSSNERSIETGTNFVHLSSPAHVGQNKLAEKMVMNDVKLSPSASRVYLTRLSMMHVSSKESLKKEDGSSDEPFVQTNSNHGLFEELLATPKTKMDTKNTLEMTPKLLIESVNHNADLLENEEKQKCGNSDDFSSSRPQRRKKCVEKMGIDNVKLSQIGSPKIYKTRTTNTEDMFDELITQPNYKGDDVDLVKNLVLTPTTKTYSKVDDPQTPGTPETPSSRPHRRKKLVEKMGIDDVDVFGSPKVCITPFSKHRNKVEENPSNERSIETTANQDNLVVVDTTNQETSENRRLSLSYPEEIAIIEDLPKKRKRYEMETNENKAVEKNSSNERSIETTTKTTTPVKPKWAVKEVGELKLRLNRTLKPVNMVQRISRRTSMQLGMTPENLLQLQTRSPSPVKKMTSAFTSRENSVKSSAAASASPSMGKSNKENSVKSKNKFSPLSSTSLHNLTTSPILNLPLERPRRPSRDSPTRKRRRVSKKLYD